MNPAQGALSGFLAGEFDLIKCDVASSAAFPGSLEFKILNISVLDGTNAAADFNAVFQ